MIPAKFPSQIWITISSAAFGISYTDRLVANFLKEQASKAEFRKLLSSDFLRITNKIRSNEILQSSIKHFPFVRIINICRRLIFVMRSMIDCVATECFDIDKINYIFIMRFDKKNCIAPGDKLILFLRPHSIIIRVILKFHWITLEPGNTCSEAYDNIEKIYNSIRVDIFCSHHRLSWLLSMARIKNVV